MKSDHELFTALCEDTGLERGAATIKKLARIADEKTHDLRVARDDAFRFYCRTSVAFNQEWKSEWTAARAAVIEAAQSQEKTDEVR